MVHPSPEPLALAELERYFGISPLLVRNMAFDGARIVSVDGALIGSQALRVATSHGVLRVAGANSTGMIVHIDGEVSQLPHQMLKTVQTLLEELHGHWRFSTVLRGEFGRARIVWSEQPFFSFN